MSRIRSYIMLVSIGLVWVISGCAGVMKSGMGDDQMPGPTIEVERMEVSHYWGWWYFSNSVKPTAGESGNYGAPLELSFILKIHNPLDFPIELENAHFTVAFEEFDLNTVTVSESQWIPAGKTNYLRVSAMMDGRQSFLNILVASGFKLKEKTGKSGSGAALELIGRWWKDIPNYGFPVFVKDGAAVFNVSSATKVVSFTGRFPREK